MEVVLRVFHHFADHLLVELESPSQNWPKTKVAKMAKTPDFVKNYTNKLTCFSE